MISNKPQILFSLALLSLSFISLSANPHNAFTLLRNTNKQICAFGFSDAVTQVTAGVATYIGLISYFDRPRGRLDVDGGAIEIRQSKVDGAGLGLFATKSLPEGTLLGNYPGVLRPAQKYMAQYGGEASAGEYTWRFTDNAYLIDPIDSEGQLQDMCYGGTADFFLSYFLHEKVLRWSVPTLLARINEPREFSFVRSFVHLVGKIEGGFLINSLSLIIVTPHFNTYIVGTIAPASCSNRRQRL